MAIRIVMRWPPACRMPDRDGFDYLLNVCAQFGFFDWVKFAVLVHNVLIAAIVSSVVLLAESINLTFDGVVDVSLRLCLCCIRP